MDILHVTLPVDDVAGAAGFWDEVLGLPVSRDPNGARVVVGSTTLLLADGDAGHEHLAITVPLDAFDRQRAWLEERTPLLDRRGTTEFTGPSGWDSRSVYFAGPSGSVLELIARGRTPGAPGLTAGPDALLRISEVGVAVPSVADAAASLAAVGLTPFAGEVEPDFGALGDDDGLLILAAEGRPWLPTADRLATRTAVELVLATSAPGAVTIGGARITSV